METDIASVDRVGLQDVIFRTRNELVILRRSLDESVESWATFGFKNLHNPTAASLRSGIAEREALLEGSLCALDTLEI